jgi:hypothetical protein
MRENASTALHAEYFLRIDSTKKNIIYLNRIFQSYMIDFGQDNDEVRHYLKKRLPKHLDSVMDFECAR